MSHGPKRQKNAAESRSRIRTKNFGKEKTYVKEQPLKVSNRDAIVSISAVVLLLACSIVIGSTIYDKTFAYDSQSTIKYGDSVKVEYVGSLYTYYDRDGSPIIFDTNVMSVASDKNRTFAYECPENFNSYNPRNVVIGNGEFLAMFEKSIIGHHIGDTIESSINAADAYPLEGEVGYLKKGCEYSISKVKVFNSNSDFKEFFGMDAPETCFTVKSPYGWNAYVMRNVNDTIEVEYLPEDSQEYDSGTGVIYKVSKVTDDRIVFQYDFLYNGVIIQAMSPSDKGAIYINEEISSEEYKYKAKSGKNSKVAGETLYFTIKTSVPG